MQGGRSEADHPGEEVGEEPGSIAQEGALTLHAPQLLKQREGYDVRVRKLLQALVTPTVRVDVLVEIVHQAEQDGECLFYESGPSDMPGSVHLMLL
jgi:hypothetical protein